MNKNEKQILPVSLVASLLVAFFYVPWLPQHFSAADVDSSWIMVLHHAFANGLKWGDDIIWHYGPLGFLFGKYYHPETYGISLALHAVMGLGTMLAIITLWRDKAENAMVPIACAALLIMTDDVVFYAAPTLFLIAYHVKAIRLKHWLTWLLLALMAIAGLTKFSYLLLCFVAVLSIEAHRFHTREMPVLYFGAYCLLWLIGWVVTGQDGLAIGTYLYGAYELGSGFNSMASLSKPVLLPLIYLALCGYWILLFTITTHKQHAALNSFTLGLAALALLVTKAAFVHDNDHHIIQALAWLLILILVTKEWFWEQSYRIFRWAFAVCALVAAGYVSTLYITQADKEVAQLSSMLSVAGDASENHDSESTSSRKTRYYEALAAIQARHPLPKLTGTADIYRNHQAALLANTHDTWKYTPRPVFQSYHAYTRYLAEKNHDFLQGEHAPGHILYSQDHLMQRYPNLDDGASLPTLLSDYALHALNGGSAHLIKAHESIKAETQIFDTQSAEWEREISIPRARRELVWAEIDMRPTLLGRIASLLLYTVPVDIEFELLSGYKRTDRYVPSLGQSGFLLSPLIDNTVQFGSLFGKQRHQLIEHNGLKSIRFTSPYALRRILWKDDITLRLYKLDVAYRQHASTLPDSLKDIFQLSIGMPEQKVHRPEQLTGTHINTKYRGGHSLLTSYNETHMRYTLTESASLSMEIGAFAGYGSLGKPGSLCHITITGHKQDRTDTIWQGMLDNTADAAERKISLSFDLNHSLYDYLTFSVTPQNDDSENWLYWRITRLQVEE